MLNLLIASFAIGQLGSIEYTGVPTISGANLTTHRVVFNIKDDYATIQSESRVVVSKSGIITLQIPMMKENEHSFHGDLPTATVDNVAVPLRAPVSTDVSAPQPLNLTGNAKLEAGNHTLRIFYKSKAARTGLGQKQRVFGYWAGNGPALDMLEFVYHYDQNTVFDIPDASPYDWHWEVGKTGAYVKVHDFHPKGEGVFLVYYSSKVEDQ